ncbi:ATP-binding protein [Chryseobacterium sp. AG844]|uniref:ligand-binding sensor domain-containing protein n=1 Tax=Chryseobacterium sp. AG844 TaxID=2183998 RepID=UPI000D82FA9F|nr:HAMP domain-containing sensor histidine kinase [Chryseobacterium sp. AG844]PWW29244.1 signal transduction histidine kinase [Chryseobacterium sp. AG844]
MCRNILTVGFLFAFLLFYSQQYTVQFFNTDNGLPQNSVKDIIKDKYGFIWLTTENGIVRYDGLNFFVHKKFPLNSQRFTYFYGDADKDSIFTAVDDGKTVLIHQKIPKVFKNIKRCPTIIVRENINYHLCISNYSYSPSPGVYFFMDFKKGRYFITQNSFVYEDFLSKSQVKLDVKPLFKNDPNAFTIGDILFYIDRNAKKVKKIEEGKITGSYDLSIVADVRSKIFWNRTNGQGFVLNNNILYRCIYNNGTLKLSKLIRLDHIDESNLMCIYYDEKYKKLYLGSSTDGLKIVSLTDFTSSKKNIPKSSAVFYAIQPYNDSCVINPAGEIYNRYGLVKSKNFDKSISYFLNFDRQGNIVTRREQTLFVYSKKSDFTDFQSISTGEDTVNDFFFANGKYYVLAVKQKKGNTEFTGTLSIYENWPFKSLKKKYLFANEPTKMVLTEAGDILVGTIKGLYKISVNHNKIYSLNGKNELSVRDIVLTADGNIWVTTLGKGFYLLKNNRLIKLPGDSEGNLLSPHTLMEDPNGYFWIPTNNGLYKIRESILLKYLQNRNFKLNYYRYSKEAGFSTNEFNGGSNINSNKLKNGDFVLPSLSGLVFFNPLKVKSYYPAAMYVERVLVDDKERLFKDTLKLSQENRQVELFIDVPYYANPDNIVIEAKLDDDGTNKWLSVGKDRKFLLNNLGHGTHHLIVRMLVSDKQEYVFKKIKIIIPPFFYQTLWFKLLIVFIFLLLLYVSVRWRTSFHKKKNRELEEIIRLRTKTLSETVENLEITQIKLGKEIEQQKKLIGTITHDITTPLKFIALTSKEALDYDEKNAYRTERILNSIYKSSNQLYNFTKTLKEYADIYNEYRSDETELYSFYDLVQEKKILFDEIAANHNTTIVNNVDEKLMVKISKNILAVIIHNLMDNSVKYTRNGTIIITGADEPETVILEITDTGIGMDDHKIEYYTKLQENIENEKLLLQKYGMGLHLILQLLQMLESKIIIRRNENKGTSFQLIIKKSKK